MLIVIINIDNNKKMTLKKHKFCTIREYISRQIMPSKSTLSKTCVRCLLFTQYIMSKS